MKKELKTRTTLRLPSAVHRQLRMVAATEGTTSEAILLEALRRELARREANQRNVEIPDEMSPLLAELFVQSLPTFVLVKDLRARIRWVNAYFEKTLRKSLVSVAGSTITEAGLVKGVRRETIEANIDIVLKGEKPIMSIEGMTLEGIGDVVVRAHRFKFANGTFLGDISFLERDLDERRFDVDRDVVQLMQRSRLAPGVGELLQQFLEAAPASMAIKRPANGSSIIVWANAEYLRLAGCKKLSHIAGRTTQEALALPPGHDVLTNEAEIVATGNACMVREQLPKRDPRWSLRFPIFDGEGKVHLIGVVSPEFQQGSAATLTKPRRS